MRELEGMVVAVLVAEGFEQVELTHPRAALERARARCEIIAPREGSVRAWRSTEWGQRVPIDVPLAHANHEGYGALLLPGGVMSADRLRGLPDVRKFVQGFFRTGKPVAAIGHAAWVLIDAGIVEGRKLTSWSSLRTDLTHAGADWVEQDVVVDDSLVTSRGPEDLVAFTDAMLEVFAEPSRATERDAMVGAAMTARGGRGRADPRLT